MKRRRFGKRGRKVVLNKEMKKRMEFEYEV